jgi:hypothetical protein
MDEEPGGVTIYVVSEADSDDRKQDRDTNEGARQAVSDQAALLAVKSGPAPVADGDAW